MGRAEERKRRRRRRRILKRVASWGLIAAAGVLYLRCAPDRYNLTAPLDLTDRPTFVTHWKLQLAGTHGCYEALRRAGIRFERLPDEVKGPGCEFENVARLDQSLVDWGRDVTLRCPMLAGLAIWERHALQPAARELLGTSVVAVRHYGTYSCRNVNNAKYGRRSEHATANAVDVAGFVLANGEDVSVVRDWSSNSAKARFLRRVRNQACDHFNTVLSPDYNELHRDHFHFDNGGYESCR